MSQVEPKPPKPPPPDSEINQVLSHGAAYREAYGRPLGALIILFAVNKARSGPLGIASAASCVALVVYHTFLK
jgi:hypothetical protein